MAAPLLRHDSDKVLERYLKRSGSAVGDAGPAVPPSPSLQEPKIGESVQTLFQPDADLYKRILAATYLQRLLKVRPELCQTIFAENGFEALLFVLRTTENESLLSVALFLLLRLVRHDARAPAPVLAVHHKSELVKALNHIMPANDHESDMMLLVVRLLRSVTTSGAEPGVLSVATIKHLVAMLRLPLHSLEVHYDGICLLNLIFDLGSDMQHYLYKYRTDAYCREILSYVEEGSFLSTQAEKLHARLKAHAQTIEDRWREARGTDSDAPGGPSKEATHTDTEDLKDAGVEEGTGDSGDDADGQESQHVPPIDTPDTPDWSQVGRTRSVKPSSTTWVDEPVWQFSRGVRGSDTVSLFDVNFDDSGEEDEDEDGGGDGNDDDDDNSDCAASNRTTDKHPTATGRTSGRRKKAVHKLSSSAPTSQANLADHLRSVPRHLVSRARSSTSASDTSGSPPPSVTSSATPAPPSPGSPAQRSGQSPRSPHRSRKLPIARAARSPASPRGSPRTAAAAAAATTPPSDAPPSPRFRRQRLKSLGDEATSALPRTKATLVSPQFPARTAIAPTQVVLPVTSHPALGRSLPLTLHREPAPTQKVATVALTIPSNASVFPRLAVAEPSPRRSTK